VTGFFQRFNRKDKIQAARSSPFGASDQPTLPQSGKPEPGGLFTVETAEPAQLLVGIGHSAGRVRENNEDALFTYSTHLVSDTTRLAFGLFLVADGMGGHQFGEKASEIAVRAMVTSVLGALSAPLFGEKARLSGEELQKIMGEGILAAHQAILEQAKGGGSTLTAALVLGENLIVAHIGDSRAYALHTDGGLQALTRDHSLVQRLVELGQISPTEAASHPQRNVLYRALGQVEPLETDLLTLPVSQLGSILLCSDGLWGVLSDEQMSHLIAASASPVQACQSLVEAANAAGGPDNISAVLVHMAG
jgi:protein phosphatase